MLGAGVAVWAIARYSDEDAEGGEGEGGVTLKGDLKVLLKTTGQIVKKAAGFESIKASEKSGGIGVGEMEAKEEMEKDKEESKESGGGQEELSGGAQAKELKGAQDEKRQEKVEEGERGFFDRLFDKPE